MPAAQRFGFMHKYSTDENSMEMGRAVDMWSECALLVACVAELNRLLNKIKVNFLVLALAFDVYSYMLYILFLFYSLATASCR